MHQLVARCLAEARRRGHVITLEAHLDALIRLEQAARDTQAVGIQEEVDWLDRPITVGDRRAVELRPLTFAGKLWIEEIEESGWFADDPITEGLALAWALACSGDPEAMQAIGTTRPRVRRALWRWARSIDGGQHALLHAARRIMQPRLADWKPPPVAAADAATAARAPGDKSYVDQLLARLCHEFGHTPQYWMFAPWKDFDAAVNLLRADAQALDKVIGKAQARDPQDPAVLAFIRWRKAQEAFLESLGPVGPAEDPAHDHDIEDQRPEAPCQTAREEQRIPEKSSQHKSTSS